MGRMGNRVRISECCVPVISLLPKDGKRDENDESQDTCLCGLVMFSQNKAKV